MRLSALVRPLLKYQVIGKNGERLDSSAWQRAEDVEVTAVTADSRQARPGCLFIAMRGYTVDGHQFAAESVRKGAIA
ncbi:MAG: hypothetical protein K6T31_05220, partial [Alicyclobacillus sp.]|nr:hypothetical protein [Alicyclobacillus sp.]